MSAQAPAPTSHRTSSRVPLPTLALAPASALGRKPIWQALANRLPGGSVLIVTAQREMDFAGPIGKIITAFQAQGYGVTTISADDLTERQLPLL